MREQAYKKISKEFTRAHRSLPSLFVVLTNGVLCFLAIYLFKKDSVIAYLLSQVVFALFLNHCYIIVHECVHNTFFPSSFLNVILGHLYSIPAMLPFYARKAEHLCHHAWAGNVEI